MKSDPIVRAGILVLAVLGVLASVWVLPPAMHRARRLCPVRPDGVAEAGAMPQWARKYGVSCNVCHTTVPRLTQAGYKFRRAGFRMPDEIGKETKFEGLKDMYSVRIREDFKVTGTATDGSASNKKVKATNQFLFNELTFYPVSGAIGQYWATLSELTFVPDEHVEVENAYLRATYPVSEDLFLTARAGIMHPQEGCGASDRALGNFRPLFQRNSAKDTFSGNAFDSTVLLWGQAQEGAEFGATYKDTTLTWAVFNGFNTKRGSADGGSNNNHYDSLIFLNQFLGEKAAVSAEFLFGKTDWGDNGATPADATADLSKSVYTPVAAVPATWVNNYQRYALYASYLAHPQLNVLGGWELGKDHRPDPSAGGSNNSDTFNSGGYFLEAESKLHDHFTASLRYDTFRPSYRTAANRLTSWTASLVAPFDWVKFMLEYQLKRAQSAVGHDRTDNTVRGEWMIHF